MDLSDIGCGGLVELLVGGCLEGVLGALASRFMRRISVEVKSIATKAGILSTRSGNMRGEEGC